MIVDLGAQATLLVIVVGGAIWIGFLAWLGTKLGTDDDDHSSS